ncbi:MAG: alpha/beta hydrolase [Caldilineaceae bacterium]
MTTSEPAVYTPTFAQMECPFVALYSVNITCGMLTVPENRGRADSRMIQVFVETIHALSDEPLPDPIVVLPGGPGDDAGHARALFYQLPVRANRDILLIDPRGTGFSQPNLDCFENGGIGFYYENAVGAAKDCFDRLQKDGIDFAGYTTAEQVADVADLAAALGLAQINLHGGSYGTRVAVQVADRYPDLVRSMMLDGVMPANVVAQLEEPLNVYNVFRRVFADCAADAACNAANPDLMARMLAVVDRYDAEPFPEGVNFAESSSELVAYIFGQIYGGTANVPAFVTAIYEEDFVTACAVLGGVGTCALPADTAATAPLTETVALTDSISVSETNSAVDGALFNWRDYFTNPEDPYGSDIDRITLLMRNLDAATPADLFIKLDGLSAEQFQELIGSLEIPATPDPASEGVYYSVWCSEEGPFYSTQAVQDVAARIPPQFGGFPTERATELKEICNLWHVPPVSAAAKVVKLSFVPTLIVNGTHDPITPPMWARRTAAYLDQVYVELFPGFGHVILSTKNTCMTSMMQAFYDDPSQEPDNSCLDELSIHWTLPE